MVINCRTLTPILGGVLHWEESAGNGLQMCGFVSRGTLRAADAWCQPCLNGQTVCIVGFIVEHVVPRKPGQCVRPPIWACSKNTETN